jgi:hypothetical protein
MWLYNFPFILEEEQESYKIMKYNAILLSYLFNEALDEGKNFSWLYPYWGKKESYACF